MSPSRLRPVAAFAGVAVVAGLGYFLAQADAPLAGLEEAREILRSAGQEHAPPPPPPPLAAASPEDILMNLPCFGCHGRERFLTEKRFGHRRHEAAGHCHVCHAISSHFEVTVRKESCTACHPTGT